MIEIQTLQHLADEADAIAMHYFNSRSISVSQKWDKSPVTQADTEIETRIRSAVSAMDSSIGIFGEEFGEDQARIRLIVDPIDGTRNFIRGIPHFGTLLAVEVDGVIVSGLISAPFHQERWWGWCHSEPNAVYRTRWGESRLRVSDIDSIERSQMFHGSFFGCEARLTPPTLWDVAARTDRQRGFGDYYLHMLVASGAGEFGVDFGLKPWDKAPLKAIVEGAGGTVTNADGEFTLNSDSIVSSNGQFHLEIIAGLNKRN